MSKMPCLHIGLPKTATTTLQSSLFPEHSGIEYLGKFIGQKRKHRDKAVKYILQEILSPPSGSRNLAKSRGLYLREVAPCLDEGRIPLWSSEGITAGGIMHKQHRAAGFNAVFGPCRVIIVLRHPLNFTRSMYLQKLKETQLNRTRGFSRGGRYYDIEWWLEQSFAKLHHGPLSNLDYLSSVEAFSEVFGKDSIGIFLFEDLLGDEDAFIRNLCGFIGVDEQEGVRLTARNRLNPRMTQGQLERLQLISGSPIRSLLFRLSSTRRRRRLLYGAQPLHGGEKATVEICEVWKNRIEDLTREGNRKLTEEWGLSLERYGYPV